MTVLTFRTELHLAGKTATGLQVPDQVLTALGAGRRPAVRATLTRVGTSGPDGPPYEYRTTVGPMAGASWLPVSAEHRAAARLTAGDQVEVAVVLDDQPRTVEVPADLQAALDADPTATAFFAGLSPSRRRAFTDWVASAKKPATRYSRVEQSVALLREQRTR